MANNIRSILPDMAKLFNNSVLTNTVAYSIVDKLDQKEFNDFTNWLKQARNAQIRTEQKSKRYGFR